MLETYQINGGRVLDNVRFSLLLYRWLEYLALKIYLQPTKWLVYHRHEIESIQKYCDNDSNSFTKKKDIIGFDNLMVFLASLFASAGLHEHLRVSGVSMKQTQPK
jgi:hypothetical protein